MRLLAVTSLLLGGALILGSKMQPAQLSTGSFLCGLASGVILCQVLRREN
jgi:hypothetical protein